jgi:hypothetical protein
MDSMFIWKWGVQCQVCATISEKIKQIGEEFEAKVGTRLKL